MKISSASANEILTRLRQSYGPQFWWPADDPFEVMIGAVLTQHTSWRNVEKALTNLKTHNAVSLSGIRKMHDTALARCLRPAGTYNVKLKRLRAFCEWLHASGGVSGLRQRDTKELRVDLLSVHGIGPETADTILLYALERPVFVIDAYARRLTQRLGWINGDETYEQMRQGFENALAADSQTYNEYHALIVAHGKQHCRSKPNCARCCLLDKCEYSANSGLV